MSLKVQLPDGKVMERESGVTPGEIVRQIGPGLAKSALAALVNHDVIDLDRPIEEDCQLQIITFESAEGKSVYWHSTSHMLAQAVQRLFPGTKLGIGPSIASGFYYDFDSEHTFTPDDLKAIEAEMEAIAKADYQIRRQELTREEALTLFEGKGETYKVELINDLPEDAAISLYEQGGFVDLCAGPHVPSTGKVKAIKLLSLAGAYWRGSEKNKMLQRIYGISFPKKSDLDDYLFKLEEAKRRDHRKLGAELKLFALLDEGPGFPFFLPKGITLRNQLESFWREEHRKWGYQEIKTPIILNRALWERSGHWDNYKENMYFTKIDEEDYAVKPMNCPGAILLYKLELHSYREFPLRLAEMGLVHRHELSGAMHGLMRVRCFTQDDAHIFLLPSQIQGEIHRVTDLFDSLYGIFGFSYHVELSTKPDKAMGSDEMWEKATNALRDALEDKGMNYIVNEGNGAFYGPKIDFHLRDCVGRTWQCGTCQLDFQMPEKFDLTYIGEDGQRHRPVMIHRTAFGSIERFIGILIEQYAGAFPVWLAPIQVKILPLTERHHEAAQQVAAKLELSQVRAEVDDRNEKIGYKIREGQMEKVPYMLVIGDKEVESGTVSVRKRGEGEQGSMPVQAFLERVLQEIAARS